MAGRWTGLVLLSLLLAGCTTEVRESDLLRPLPDHGLSGEALAKVAPAYTLTEERIVASDGTRLYAVHLRQPGARITILYFGGNGYTIGRFGALSAAVFAPLGVDLMLVDHRGYGLSEGTPTAERLDADGLAIFDQLAKEVGGGDHIVVHGQSLGSFIAGRVAAERTAAGVVLESSATTAEQWVHAATPAMARPFLHVRVDESLRSRGNLGNVGKIEEPLLLLVGRKDKTTPPVLSRALYAASPLPQGRKTLMEVAGAGHDDVMLKPEAIAAYRAFLEQLPAR